MGKRGPAKEPTALKLVKGTAKAPVTEPVPADGEIVPPYRLTKAVQQVWDRLAPDRIRKGVLTQWDVDAFALFCELIVLNQEALRAAHKGILVQGARSNEKIYNRAMQGVRETSEKLATIGSRFGWTPADRTALTMSEEKRGEAERLLS